MQPIKVKHIVYTVYGDLLEVVRVGGEYLSVKQIGAPNSKTYIIRNGMVRYHTEASPRFKHNDDVSYLTESGQMAHGYILSIHLTAELRYRCELLSGHDGSRMWVSEETLTPKCKKVTRHIR